MIRISKQFHSMRLLDVERYDPHVRDFIWCARIRVDEQDFTVLRGRLTLGEESCVWTNVTAIRALKPRGSVTLEV